MDNPIYSYFHENLATVSKEELLLALGNALESANCWRQACLLGYPSLQTRSQGEVGIESGLHDAYDKEVQVSAKV
jgi:hypothetical protein